MYKYFFILGRNPTLSFAEIISVLEKQEVKYNIVSFSDEVLVIQTEIKIDGKQLISILGGTVKIGQVMDQINLEEDVSKLDFIFSYANLLDKYITKPIGKIHFGISVYDSGMGGKYVNLLSHKLLELNLTIKDNLKTEGINSGFVRIKDRYLSSVSVEKNRLLRSGLEFVIVVFESLIIIGKTLAVQEYGSFGFRDMQRPNKDKKSGIMPPKLARIMINLAKLDSGGVLLDPFCGSGTIISEAVTLHINKIIGADISSKAVSDTKSNLEWLFKTYAPNNKKYDKNDYNIQILQTDVNNIPEKIGENFIDAVVTEPFLGPPLYRKQDITNINRIFSEVEKLYLCAFAKLGKVLKSNGNIIIIFPSFDFEGKKYFLEIIAKLNALGFRKNEYFSQNLKMKLKIDLTERGTILYKSRDQFLTREIIFFTKI